MSESSVAKATAATTTEVAVNWLKLPWSLLWFLPGLSVVAGLITVFIAVRYGDSMVKDDYYRQGLAYNAQQQADQAAAAINLQAMLVMVNEKQLLVTISAEQLPVLPAQLQMQLSHPTHSSADQLVNLRQQSGQQYVADLTVSAHADWHVQLQPEDGSWRLRGRWQSPAPAQLKPEVL